MRPTKQYKLSRKEILLYFAPDEMKDFIEKLSKIETKKDYNKFKKENNDIFEQYPEFTGEWKYNKEDGKTGTKTHNYNLILNETTQVQETGKIYKILNKFPKSQNLKVGEINTKLSTYYNSKQTEAGQRAAEEMERQRKQEEEDRRKKHEEEIAEVEKRKDKEKEELAQNIKAEDNKILNEHVAKTKHKTKKEYEEELKEKEEENEKLKKELEEAKNKINDRLKAYIRDHYIIDSPKTREELYEKVAKDPNLKADTKEDINNYVNYILEKQIHRLITSKTKIIKTAKLFGNDADYLSKLDPMVRDAVLRYQTQDINKTIIDKNNKYLLPKKYIKFEKAINDHKVNPLILRGLYVK